jgi:hypothetical protein
MDDSTGLKSATKLNTPRTRCESRVNSEWFFLLTKRRSKTKEKASTSAEAFSAYKVDRHESR